MRVLFITQDGKQLPTARVRGYAFAEIVKKSGMEAELLSYRDHLKASRHGVQLCEMGWGEKILLNLRALPKLFSAKVDLFYIQKINYHILAPVMISKFRRIPYLIDFDDFEYLEEDQDAWQNRVIRYVLRRAAGVVASSHALADWCSMHNSNTFLIPTGVDAAMFSPKMEICHRSQTLVWLGVVIDRLIFDTILDIVGMFEQIATRDQTVNLCLVLKGRYLSEIKTQVHQSPAAERIQVHENVAHQDVPELLSRATIGFLTYHMNNRWVISKSPTKLFEYMAAGLVPICTRGTEADHVIRHGINGFLIESLKEGQKIVEFLLRNPSRMTEISRSARDTILQGYCWENLGVGLQRVIRSVMDP
ncbi:MAG: glycosyltransferase family 4 protein [Acidobacteria bacterium]|nr:glycosyltransferase family 4 protein [Acidobacteriota bacterium]